MDFYLYSCAGEQASARDMACMALTQWLVCRSHLALFQHGVHKRGFAVVNMRNDGDVADVLTHGRQVRLRCTGRARRWRSCAPHLRSQLVKRAGLLSLEGA